MMPRCDTVAVSPEQVYRVLQEAGSCTMESDTNPRKGRRLRSSAEAAIEHWHIDICYVNIQGTCLLLCSVLDGYSRIWWLGDPLNP